jgi:phage terminase large subunit
MIVTVKQFSKKFAILDSKKRFIGLRGGRGSGKSWAIIRWLVANSCNYKMDIACCRAIWTNIKESAYKLVVETIFRLGLTDQFRITDTYILNITTGSRFIFLGLNHNPAGIKSMEGYHVVFIEEGEQIIEDAWEKLIPTIVRKKGSKIICAWNPNLPTDPVEKEFNPATNPDCIVEHINYLENPFCDQGIIDAAERMKAENPQKYNWIYLGQFRPEGNETFIGLQLVMDAIGRPPCPVDDTHAIVGGLDLGFYQDRTVFSIRHHHNIQLTKVWVQPNVNDIVPEIIGLMSRYKVSKIGIDCLGPGAPVIQMFEAEIGENRVVPVAYSAASSDPQYKNCRAEAWGLYKDLLQDGSLPEGMDNDFITDSCNIRYFYDSDGKIQLESKKSLVQRGFRSSDIVDSIGISLIVDDKLTKTTTIVPRRRQEPSDWMAV